MKEPRSEIRARMVMLKSRFSLFVASLLLLTLAGIFASAGERGAGVLPNPTVDEPVSAKSGQATVVFAGGCFWGVQAVFQHVKGVVSATSGYSGGPSIAAEYEVVSTGTTGHAESVKVVYDPAKVSYGQLLKVFFSVAHDPTELNRQGPDQGTQYRSVIFYSSELRRPTSRSWTRPKSSRMRS